MSKTQYVEYRGVESYFFSCPSGVSYGSNLSLLFFATFINDKGENVGHSNLPLFVIKIYCNVEYKEDCFRLQDDLISIAQRNEEQGITSQGSNVSVLGRVRYRMYAIDLVNYISSFLSSHQFSVSSKIPSHFT